MGGEVERGNSTSNVTRLTNQILFLLCLSHKKKKKIDRKNIKHSVVLSTTHNLSPAFPQRIVKSSMYKLQAPYLVSTSKYMNKFKKTGRYLHPWTPNTMKPSEKVSNSTKILIHNVYTLTSEFASIRLSSNSKCYIKATWKPTFFVSLQGLASLSS